MEIRKVCFTLVNPQNWEFNPDETEQEREELEGQMKEREGYFHCWTEDEIISPESGNYIVKKVAIIEDVATGEMHEIPHENFKFIKK